MNVQLGKLMDTLKPFKGILCFMILLFGSHFLWKLIVDANIDGPEIAIFGKDMSEPFYRLSQWTAKVVHWFVCLFPGSENFVLKDTLMYFPDGKIRINIIWGCTGVKQLYIFLAIMLLYPGPWKKKAWYIPLGCVILMVYNILRIAGICWLTKDHPENFDFLHEGLFKYIYYGLIFLLWVIWEEVYAKQRE